MHSTASKGHGLAPVPSSPPALPSASQQALPQKHPATLLQHQPAVGQRVLADPPGSWRVTQPTTQQLSTHLPTLHTCFYLDSLGLQTPASMTSPPPWCSVPQRAATPGGMRRCKTTGTKQLHFCSATARVSSTMSCWELLRCSGQSLCPTAAPNAAGTPI